MWRETGDFLSLEKDLSARGMVVAGDDIEKGGLARPVGPDQGVAFPFLYLEIHVEKDFQTFEGVVEPLGFENYHLRTAPLQTVSL
jgi:hypothetical protein